MLDKEPPGSADVIDMNTRETKNPLAATTTSAMNSQPAAQTKNDSYTNLRISDTSDKVNQEIENLIANPTISQVDVTVDKKEDQNPYGNQEKLLDPY